MKNKTDIWHVFTDSHDEYYTPAEGGERRARERYAQFMADYDCARLYHRKKGENEESDGDCIASDGRYPS